MAAPQNGYPPHDPMYPKAPLPNGNYPYPSQQGPPPPGYGHPPPVAQPPAAPAAPATVFMQNVGPRPSRTTCRSCNIEVVTRIEQKTSTKTHLIAVFLCVIGCIPCCLIPYCIDSLQDIEHFCPSCNSFMGSYKS